MEIIEVNFKAKKKIPSINRRFLEEAQLLEARWNKSGLLDGIKEKFSRQVCAVLLEGQRLMNEVAKDEKSI